MKNAVKNAPEIVTDPFLLIFLGGGGPVATVFLCANKDFMCVVWVLNEYLEELFWLGFRLHHDGTRTTDYDVKGTQTLLRIEKERKGGEYCKISTLATRGNLPAQSSPSDNPIYWTVFSSLTSRETANLWEKPVISILRRRAPKRISLFFPGIPNISRDPRSINRL